MMRQSHEFDKTKRNNRKKKKMMKEKAVYSETTRLKEKGLVRWRWRFRRLISSVERSSKFPRGWA